MLIDDFPLCCILLFEFFVVIPLVLLFRNRGMRLWPFDCGQLPNDGMALVVRVYVLV